MQGADKGNQAKMKTDENSINFRPSLNFKHMKKYLKSKFEQEMMTKARSSRGEQNTSLFSHNKQEKVHTSGARTSAQPPLPPYPPPPDNPPMIMNVRKDIVDNAYRFSATKNPPKFNKSHELKRVRIKTEAPSEKPAVLMCRNFVRGNCTRGAECIFAHELILSQLYGVYTFCRNFQNEVCTFPNCKFVHATVFEKEHFFRTGYLPPHTLAHLKETTVLQPPPPPPWLPEEKPAKLPPLYSYSPAPPTIPRNPQVVIPNSQNATGRNSVFRTQHPSQYNYSAPGRECSETQGEKPAKLPRLCSYSPAPPPIPRNPQVVIPNSQNATGRNSVFKHPGHYNYSAPKREWSETQKEKPAKLPWEYSYSPAPSPIPRNPQVVIPNSQNATGRNSVFRTQHPSQYNYSAPGRECSETQGEKPAKLPWEYCYSPAPSPIPRNPQVVIPNSQNATGRNSVFRTQHPSQYNYSAPGRECSETQGEKPAKLPWEYCYSPAPSPIPRNPQVVIPNSQNATGRNSVFRTQHPSQYNYSAPGRECSETQGEKPTKLPRVHSCSPAPPKIPRNPQVVIPNSQNATGRNSVFRTQHPSQYNYSAPGRECSETQGEKPAKLPRVHSCSPAPPTIPRNPQVVIPNSQNATGRNNLLRIIHPSQYNYSAPGRECSETQGEKPAKLPRVHSCSPAPPTIPRNPQVVMPNSQNATGRNSVFRTQHPSQYNYSAPGRECSETRGEKPAKLPRVHSCSPATPTIPRNPQMVIPNSQNATGRNSVFRTQHPSQYNYSAPGRECSETQGEKPAKLPRVHSCSPAPPPIPRNPQVVIPNSQNATGRNSVFRTQHPSQYNYSAPGRECSETQGEKPAKLPRVYSCSPAPLTIPRNPQVVIPNSQNATGRNSVFRTQHPSQYNYSAPGCECSETRKASGSTRDLHFAETQAKKCKNCNKYEFRERLIKTKIEEFSRYTKEQRRKISQFDQMNARLSLVFEALFQKALTEPPSSAPKGFSVAGDKYANMKTNKKLNSLTKMVVSAFTAQQLANSKRTTEQIKKRYAY